MGGPTLPLVTVETELPPLDGGYEVTDDQVADFRREGHLRLDGVAGADELAAYRQVISAAALRHSSEHRPLAERDTYGKAFLQIENLWRLDAGAARFVTARRFAGVAARLLGVARVRLYHDQALFKEAGGGPTPWHQDAVYWPLDTDRTVTMWMPLVDVSEEMGGMVFASGSHTGRELAGVGISDDSESYFDRMVADGRFTATRPQAMRAGDTTFHSGWTLHRALPNRSAVTREVMTIIYLADGARVLAPRHDWQHKEIDSWMPGLSPGELVNTPLNPLL